jgi:hypothetical protein
LAEILIFPVLKFIKQPGITVEVGFDHIIALYKLTHYPWVFASIPMLRPLAFDEMAPQLIISMGLMLEQLHPAY